MRGPVAIVRTLPKTAKETLRVGLDNGRRCIDLRACERLSESSGVLIPTKAGVSLDIAKIPDLIEALQEAERQARELGWLGADA